MPIPLFDAALGENAIFKWKSPIPMGTEKDFFRWSWLESPQLENEVPWSWVGPSCSWVTSAMIAQLKSQMMTMIMLFPSLSLALILASLFFFFPPSKDDFRKMWKLILYVNSIGPLHAQGFGQTFWMLLDEINI